MEIAGYPEILGQNYQSISGLTCQKTVNLLFAL
jgi:hypothetical protein